MGLIKPGKKTVLIEKPVKPEAVGVAKTKKAQKKTNRLLPVVDSSSDSS
jgi:hypothetical protein